MQIVFRQIRLTIVDSPSFQSWLIEKLLVLQSRAAIGEGGHLSIVGDFLL